MARTVVIQESGELVLPRETLEESDITAGTELVVIARAGQILLLDVEQVRRRLEEIGRQMMKDRYTHGSPRIEARFTRMIRQLRRHTSRQLCRMC